MALKSEDGEWPENTGGRSGGGRMASSKEESSHGA